MTFCTKYDIIILVEKIKKQFFYSLGAFCKNGIFTFAIPKLDKKKAFSFEYAKNSVFTHVKKGGLTMDYGMTFLESFVDVTEPYGYARELEAGFVVTRGAANPEEFSNVEDARSYQRTVPGATLTYRVSVPPEEKQRVQAAMEGYTEPEDFPDKPTWRDFPFTTGQRSIAVNGVEHAAMKMASAIEKQVRPE